MLKNCLITIPHLPNLNVCSFMCCSCVSFYLLVLYSFPLFHVICPCTVGCDSVLVHPAIGILIWQFLVQEGPEVLLRRLRFLLCIFFFLSIVFFNLYQKSIYYLFLNNVLLVLDGQLHVASIPL